MRRPSRTSDDHSAPDPIAKPGRRKRDDTELARDPGWDRLRKPRPPNQFAADRRADAPDAPGGVDAPDSGVSCNPPRVAAWKRHSAGRVRSHVIALLPSTPRRGIRDPVSPSGLLPRPARRRTSGRISVTPRIKHSGMCPRTADKPGRERGQAGGPGRLSLMRRSARRSGSGRRDMPDLISGSEPHEATVRVEPDAESKCRSVPRPSFAAS